MCAIVYMYILCYCYFFELLNFNTYMRIIYLYINVTKLQQQKIYKEISKEKSQNSNNKYIKRIILTTKPINTTILINISVSSVSSVQIQILPINKRTKLIHKLFILFLFFKYSFYFRKRKYYVCIKRCALS